MEIWLFTNLFFHPMKTILVPTDLSDVSEYALDVAVEIARKQGATISLLKKIIFPTLEYTIIDNEFYDSKEEFYKYLTKDSKERLQDMVDKPRYEGVKFRFKIMRDNDSLASIVAHQNANLIVMGSTGATGWKEWTKGSNAEHVVREASCPVLVVKAPATEFQRVVVAIDFENTDFVKSALDLLDKSKIDPYFVFIDNGMKYFEGPVLKETMGKLALEWGLQNYNFEIFNDDTIEKGILDYAKEVEADIIVMYTHGRKGFEHLIYGSVAEDVVNHSDIPVLVSH
jgi:nucleotide-binding universal stress UspA family protein